MRLRELAIALSLVGCGSVSDNGNMPDAPADAPDTAAPMIVDSHPANNDKSVSVIQPITIVVDEALDPATVTAANIKVRATTKGSLYGTLLFSSATENVFLMPGTATYEPKKIIFTPIQPLPYNAHVDVTIDGVKDVAGNVFTTHLAFDTLSNTENIMAIYNGNNALAGYYDFGVAANGVPGRFNVSADPGADKIWMTPDDVHENHFDQVYDMGGHFTVLHLFDIGTDNMWGTPDDVESDAYIFAFDAMGRLTEQSESSAKGLDGMWGTGDDVPSQIIAFKWMGDNFTSQITFTNAGTDGMWRSPDDQMSSATTTYFTYSYDTMNLRTRQVLHTPGPDKIPGNADDTTTRYFDITNDANGFVTRNVQRAAGPNGTFFDSDDVNTNYTDTTRDARGLPTEIKFYDTAGPNGTWFNADDHMSTRQTKTYNAAGLVTEEITWNAGTNGTLGDADDVISERYVTTYDAKGARVSSTYYTDPGPDGMFKTSDDEIQYRRMFDMQH